MLVEVSCDCSLLSWGMVVVVVVVGVIVTIESFKYTKNVGFFYGFQSLKERRMKGAFLGF